MQTTHWNQVFPGAFETVRRELQDAFNQSVERNAKYSTNLPLTIWEDDDSVYLEADVPGFSDDAIDIRFQDGQLWITGERPVSKEDGKYWYNERMFGSFRRAVSLPDVVDPSGIAAELSDGVLHVTMTKKVEAQPLRITVKSNGHARGKRKIEKSKE